MFKKPFRVKSQIQLKSSEKKKFSGEVKTLFPSLTEDDLAQLCSSKENIIKAKIITYSDDMIELYLIDKIPMFFEIVDHHIKLPTVYMCWKFPHITTKFTTNAAVLDKLKTGADLFLPGVYTDTVEFRDSQFFIKSAAAVNLVTNSAALAVGQCLLSKGDVMSEASLLDGRLMKIYHIVGDYLCKSHPQPVPTSEPPMRLQDEGTTCDMQNPVPSTTDISIVGLTLQDPCKESSHGTSDELLDKEYGQRATDENVNSSSSDAQNLVAPVDERTLMNDLLTYCFIKALKTAPKSIYPILPAAFYANHILQAVPSGEVLNVKKTKWKKLSGLLQEMANDGVIQLETVRPNEYRIVAANTGHHIVREFVDPHHTPITVEAAPSIHASTTVQEVFVVTPATQPLFKGNGLQKGDEITRLDIRSALTEYIRREGLALPDAPDRIKLDPVLATVIKKEGTMMRLEALSGVLAAMPLRHKVSSGQSGDTIVHKANLPRVEFDVVTRSGNKKVTMISNVESYGVNVAEFAKSLQIAAAASTSITPSVPGKKGPQVQVQGNQVLTAAKLLTENHGISEKYMRGLDKAPKKKK